MAQFLPGEQDATVIRPFAVMHSFEQFREWFLKQYDFTMFSDEEISNFFDETRPDAYPCIPFFGSRNSVYPTHYISVQTLNAWMAQLETA